MLPEIFFRGGNHLAKRAAKGIAVPHLGGDNCPVEVRQGNTSVGQQGLRILAKDEQAGKRWCVIS
jgi:hypothetical protein